MTGPATAVRCRTGAGQWPGHIPTPGHAPAGCGWGARSGLGGGLRCEGGGGKARRSVNGIQTSAWYFPSKTSRDNFGSAQTHIWRFSYNDIQLNLLVGRSVFVEQTLNSWFNERGGNDHMITQHSPCWGNQICCDCITVTRYQVGWDIGFVRWLAHGILWSETTFELIEKRELNKWVHEKRLVRQHSHLHWK